MINTRNLSILAVFLPAMALAQITYTVRPGDTLLSIVDREMGISNKKDPRRYQWAQKIRAQNPQIKNPNALEPGDVINLPERPDAKPVVQAPPPTPPAHEPAPTLPAPAPVPAKPALLVSAPVAPPAPVELPAVPHAEAPASHAEGAHHDFVGLQPRFQFLSLKATDEATKEEAKLTAKASVGLDLQYGKILNDKWHLLAQVGFTYTEFKPIEGIAGVTIDHSQESQKFFALGVAYEISHSLHFDAFINTADRTFLIPTGTGTWELKGVMIPGAEANLSWDFIQGQGYVVGGSVIAEHIAELSKDDVKYKSSLEPVGALYWTSKRGAEKLNYRASVLYKNGHQHTSVSEQKEEALIAGLMVSVPL